VDFPLSCLYNDVDVMWKYQMPRSSRIVHGPHLMESWLFRVVCLPRQRAKPMKDILLQSVHELRAIRHFTRDNSGDDDFFRQLKEPAIAWEFLYDNWFRWKISGTWQQT
jgi:hypothetical protein